MEADLLQYTEELKKIAYSICRDEHLAKDIVQETYIEALIALTPLSLEDLKELCKKIALIFKDEAQGNIAKPLGTFIDNEGNDANSFVLEQLHAGTVDTFEVPQEKKKNKEEIELEYIHRMESLTPPGTFLDFKTARAYVQTLELQSKDEWTAFRRTYRRPRNIPFHPKLIYKKQWNGIADWLGYAFWTYEECRIWVQTNLVPKGIDSMSKWSAMDKSSLPRQIPKDPYDHFTRKDEWKSSEDFFGIKRINPRREIFNQNEGIQVIQKELLPAGIDSNKKYDRYIKQLWENNLEEHHHMKLPPDPTKTWNLKWSEIWKLAGRPEKKLTLIQKSIRPYLEAREWVRFNVVIPFGITTQDKWQAYVRGEYPDIPPLPIDIPSDLRTYRKYGIWNGYGAFLGTFATNKKVYWPFERAHSWILENLPREKVYDFKSWEEYRKGNLADLPSLPSEIPPEPWLKYKGKGYKNIQHWLGQKEWGLSEIKEFILENLIPHRIDNLLRFNQYLSGAYPQAPLLPKDFPKALGQYTKKHPKEAIFGTKKEQETYFVKSIPRGNILKFENAKWYTQKFLVPKGIDTLGKYLKYHERPRFLPERPDLVYSGKGWTTINDFFGTNYENSLEANSKNAA